MGFSLSLPHATNCRAFFATIFCTPIFWCGSGVTFLFGGTTPNCFFSGTDFTSIYCVCICVNNPRFMRLRGLALSGWPSCPCFIAREVCGNPGSLSRCDLKPPRPPSSPSLLLKKSIFPYFFRNHHLLCALKRARKRHFLAGKTG